MITNGFTYIAVLVFIAALLVWLQRYTKSKFFDYAPPIVLLYLITIDVYKRQSSVRAACLAATTSP